MLLLACGLALATDVDVYRSAMRHVDERYLWPERVDHAAMFRAAADRIETRVEWLTVAESGSTAVLSSGRWHHTVQFSGDLPLALSELESGVRDAGLDLPPALDLRAELLTGALSTLDRHSVALAGDNLDRFDERLSGTLTGIGVTLRNVDEHLTIIEVFAGSPAEGAGFLPNDKLVRIDGVSTVGMLPSDATDRIRGRAGTPVRIAVLRNDRPIEASLTRSEVRIPNVTWTEGPRGTGVVHIDHFSEQTTANLADAVSRLLASGWLKHGLIVDLRGNTGGSLIQSAKSADLFTDAGRIVMTAGRQGEKVAGLVREIEAKPGAQLYDGPIVVLIDHETASGAEILAGALLHLDRAILIGETSFGKGTVQTIYQLAQGLKIKLTVAEYILADDARVATVGLVPDLAMYPVDISESQVEYDELARVRSRLADGVPLFPWARPTGNAAPDEPLEIAAALLESGVTADRASLLAALTALGPSLEVQTASRLAESLRARGLDWSEPLVAPATTQATVRLETQSTPRAGESVTVIAHVTNTGSPLAQAAIRLRSVNRLWDDLLLPIGALSAGTTATAEATVRVAPDAPARIDRVIAQLECAGCTSAEVLDTTLGVEGGESPMLAVQLRRVEAGVAITVENRSGGLLPGVRASLAFPQVLGVELLDAPRELHALAAGETMTVTVPMRVAAEYTGNTIPLTLAVRADGFGTFVEWDLDLAVDGTPLDLAPPELSVKLAKLHRSPGTASLNVVATDTDGLRHLTVSGGIQRVDRNRWEPSVRWDEDKLAYWGNLERRISQAVTVPVAPGTNRYEITAVDKTGLRSTHIAYIYGDGTPPPDDGVALAP